MNYQPVTLTVKSIEGIEFVVATDERAIPYELAFAATKTAAELEQHGDFVRVAGSRTFTEAEFLPQPSEENFFEPDALPPSAEPEALTRARARWGRAGYVVGDKP